MNPAHMQIDLSREENIKCEECEGEIFSPAFIIKRISPLISPDGKETLVPLQIFKCGKCDHVNELFLEGITN